MSPTPRTALAAAIIAATALLLPMDLVVLALVALAAAVAVDLRFARRVPAVTSSLPTVAARGAPAPVAVEVAAMSGVASRVRQPFPPDLSVEPDEADDGLQAVFTAHRRGRHHVPAPVVRRTGPLRLARCDHAGGAGTDVVVYPDLPAARRLATAVREGRFDPTGRRPRGPLGLGTEFEYVREYTPDDDIRQVNWPATARVGRPMSNQYRLDQEREVVLVVDSGRLMAAPVGDRTRLDAAVDAAVAVAAVADVLGDRCGLVAFAGGVRRQMTARRSAGRRVVEAVHDLEPLPEDSDYELAFRTIGGRKRALVLVFTDLLDEAAARTLVDAVPILVRRHAVVIAGIADPDVAAILRTPPSAVAELCAQAVAVDLQDARSAVAVQLQRAGATVIDAAPGTLSEACVAAYLRLKARARL